MDTIRVTNAWYLTFNWRVTRPTSHDRAALHTGLVLTDVWTGRQQTSTMMTVRRMDNAFALAVENGIFTEGATRTHLHLPIVQLFGRRMVRVGRDERCCTQAVQLLGPLSRRPMKLSAPSLAHDPCVLPAFCSKCFSRCYIPCCRMSLLPSLHQKTTQPLPPHTERW